MIHLPLLVPLLAVGFIGAAWREHQQRRLAAVLPLGLPRPIVDHEKVEAGSVSPEQTFDDVGELQHYQRVSWYGLALAASGSWFYAPATLASIPLLGYNTYQFSRLLRHTDAAGRKSPMTVFEGVGLVGTLATGQFATAAVLLVLAFGSRKLLLQAGNITQIGFSRALDPRFATVWLLRDGVEIEAALRDVREGDVFVVRAGDTVLIEGTVLQGEGVVRQYSLLKKTKLLDKHIGDKVFPFTQIDAGCLHVKRV